MCKLTVTTRLLTYSVTLPVLSGCEPARGSLSAERLPSPGVLMSTYKGAGVMGSKPSCSHASNSLGVGLKANRQV